MKKYITATAALLMTGALALSACKKDPGEQPLPPVDNKTVTVTANEESVDIKDTAVAGYDYTGLFTITVDGEAVSVLAQYIDSSEVQEAAGSYTVSCTYEEKSASVAVNVIATVYEVTLSTEQVTLRTPLVSSYEFKSLFTASVDGKSVEITDAMVETDVKAEVGEYTYKVTVGTASKKLKVKVIPEHDVLIVPSYVSIEIPVNELADYDYTYLFSIYADGEAVRVTEDMLTVPSFENATVGDTAEVVINYTFSGISDSKSVTVKVADESLVTVNAKNIVTYPNSEFIDLTTLFEITKGGVSVPVTADMITGSVDYSAVGVNEIVLNYNGATYTAKVEIKRGVVISLTKGDTVVITRGANKAAYAFVNDFSVLINGIKFTDLDAFIDVSEVDFSTAGVYTAKIRIPYNDKGFSITGAVNFTYFEETITYRVVANNYSVVIGQEMVILPKGTDSYNIKNNITVTINGRKQQLVDNKEWVDSIACYYEVLSDPIDFTDKGEQEVRVAIYVNGVDADPYIASYFVVMESEITVTATDAAVFSGNTLYATDLFKVTVGGEEVEVTFDMLSGKVDTFTPGTYFVSIDYDGIIKTAQVIVFDSSLLGTYHTGMVPIPEPASSSGSDVDDEYYDGDIYSLSSMYSLPSNTLGDMVITADGITVNGRVATDVSGIDGNTMTFKLGSNDYTLLFNDGIVILNPDNSLRLAYTDSKRPLVYFHEDKWELQDAVTINYAPDYVLSNTNPAYSIDTFRLKPADGGSSVWYGLMVNLIERTNMGSSTIYSVAWGYAEYADDFVPVKDTVSSMTFDGTTYSFTMQSRTVGKVNKNVSQNLYANITFKGIVDGQNAELRADRSEHYTFVVGNTTVFSDLGSDYDYTNVMNNGGANYAEKTISLNSFGDSDDYEIFSYRFSVDPENETFVLLEKDKYFGRYETDGMYIFLDGYGTGLINFDSSSHSRTQLSYTVNGNVLNLHYLNAKPNSEYGTSSTLYIDSLLNVLTAQNFQGAEAGLRFENIVIRDGAIVRVKNYVIGADSNTIAKFELLQQIQIITKDGELSYAEKEKLVGTNYVNFNTPGFYQFTITVQVGGKNVTNYYAVQVLEAIYANNPVAAIYGSGVINRSFSLTIDKYGRATVNCVGTVYSGFAVIAADNTFVIRASNAESGAVTATGTVVGDGIIQLRCSGAAVFSDYFTTGTSRVAGTSGCVLRQITVGDTDTFILCVSDSSLGSIVTVEGDIDTIGSTVTITDGSGKTITAKILAWNSATAGLQIIS